jgi:hypothetical protein
MCLRVRVTPIRVLDVCMASLSSPCRIVISDGSLRTLRAAPAGPDHMSAIAALTAGDHYAKAFSAGIRWGMGHSTGLFVVACIFLSLKGQLDLDKVRRSARPLRGVKRFQSMLALVFDVPIPESGLSPASCTESLITAMRCQPCMLS